MNDNSLNELMHITSTPNVLASLAYLKKNICVISVDKITLVIAENRVGGKNASSFVGSSRAIKLGNGMNKKAIKDFENFLKKNATCGSEISIFKDDNHDIPIGSVFKVGDLFVPPSICRES